MKNRCLVLFLVIAFIPLIAQEYAILDPNMITKIEIERIDSVIENNPLRPPNTNSPRSTLMSFLENVNQSYKILVVAHSLNQQVSDEGGVKKVKLRSSQAEELLERSISCLNLTEVPEAFKEDFGYEKSLLLKEVLDRIELPPLHEIPDYLEILEEQESKKHPVLNRWRIPNTQIVIERVEEGPFTGQYLFTRETVRNINDYYHKIKHLPYKTTQYITPHYYNFYITTPGRLLPPRWSNHLPQWTKNTFLNQNIWQWIALVAVIFLFILASWLINRILFKRKLKLLDSIRLWRQGLYKLYIIAVLSIFFYLINEQINFTGPALYSLSIVISALNWILFSVAALNFGNAIAEKMIQSPSINKNDIQASYIRAISGITSLIAAIAIFISGLARIGVSLVPLLSAIGIGGLAIALAARPTLENLIGSFIIFADKPYNVGQRIIVNGHDGFVESIGLRSTKIRNLTGHRTSIPNEIMAKSEIENVGLRPYIRRMFNITIPYTSSLDQMNRAVYIIREILALPEDIMLSLNVDNFEEKLEKGLHKNVGINHPEYPPRVHLKDIEADSLSILVLYWHRPPVYWDFLEHSDWVNTQIMERFANEGIEITMPMQKVFVEGKQLDNNHD